MNMTDQAHKREGEVSRVDPVVLLVDNKGRDLEIAVLIARHLESLGVGCRLEPLEAFRAALAHRPSMIVFNHLNASHLAAWSHRLADIGVLVGVIPNEGFVYNRAGRAFMSGRFHKPHVDHFFCWNEFHKEALMEEGDNRPGAVHVVGVPRFDFYFEPWSRLLPAVTPRRSGKPRILFCTNFVFARFVNRMQDAAALFAGKQQFAGSLVKDYVGAVQSHWRSRNKITEYLTALLDDGRFEVVLRPHPIEEKAFYEAWMKGLSAERRARLLYEPTGGIAQHILDCDLEISCESCTTAVESWIARKPTIDLIFDKHPMLYKEEPAAANIDCSGPAELPGLVAAQLANPLPAGKKTLRDAHLEKWCSSPDGTSALQIARVIAEAAQRKHPADWSKLDSADKRRARKLQFYRSLGLPYHHDWLLGLKASLRPKRYAAKLGAYRKSIKPGDVSAMRSIFDAAERSEAR